MYSMQGSKLRFCIKHANMLVWDLLAMSYTCHSVKAERISSTLWPPPGFLVIYLLGRACLPRSSKPYPSFKHTDCLPLWRICSANQMMRTPLDPCRDYFCPSKYDRLVAMEDVASHAAEVGKLLPVWKESWEVGRRARCDAARGRGAVL